ncbi:MAG: sugar phosphate nucleotidyltransferase, partial [Azonexus sp.]
MLRDTPAIWHLPLQSTNSGHERNSLFNGYSHNFSCEVFLDLLPVVLSGGSGTRLWPISREKYP